MTDKRDILTSDDIDLPLLFAYYLSNTYELDFDTYVTRYKLDKAFRDRVHENEPKKHKEV